MAKFLKQNQVKVGTTMYVTHPKFSSILCKFVTSRPILDHSNGWNFAKFKYKTVSHHVIDNGKAVPVMELLKTQNEWKEYDGYCGDDGIPDKNGVFSYKQERRAFPTLNKALDYWVSQQTPENKKRWKEEDEKNFNFNFGWDW